MSAHRIAVLIEVLRTGCWLTVARARLWALAVLIASAGGLLYLIVSAHGLIDFKGRPIGTDFSNVYAAGTYVLEGRPEAPFDPALQYAREQAIFGDATPFYGWHYPPFFLFVAAALALLPYGLALVVWQGATLPLYLLAIRAIVYGAPATRTSESSEPFEQVRGSWLIFALAFPAVFINLTHGHNGFLTAGLLGGALVLLDRRPAVSGLLLGLMIYKPQFGLLIPVVLASSGRWRSFASAGLTVAGLVAVTTLAFGLPVWSAFLDSTQFTKEVVLEAGGTGWYKIQSVFAALRMWGAPLWLAYAAQGMLGLGLTGILIALWRSRSAFALKAAALAIATLLATPYSLDYDMMVLAPAIAWLAVDGTNRGFLSFEKTGLAVLWLVPLVARPIAEVTLVPLGVITTFITMILLLRRAMVERRRRYRKAASFWVAPPTVMNSPQRSATEYASLAPDCSAASNAAMPDENRRP